MPNDRLETLPHEALSFVTRERVVAKIAAAEETEHDVRYVDDSGDLMGVAAAHKKRMMGWKCHALEVGLELGW